MKIVITAATEIEWRSIKEHLNPLYSEDSNRFHVSFHTSGVSILPSTFSLTKLINEHKPNLVIQVGIAGSFNHNVQLGTAIVAVKDEFLGDAGVEENGTFKDLFDLGLAHENNFPFSSKALTNPHLNQYNLLKLPTVTSVTVNEVTTNTERIKQLQKKYDPAIESMEGAPLHYVCLQSATPFIQIRAVSNFIGERDKSKWKIADALHNLQTTVIKYTDELYKNY